MLGRVRGPPKSQRDAARQTRRRSKLANQSFSESHEPTQGAMRSGMLSASYERWRRNHHPYPLYVPDQLKQLTPLPVHRVTQMMMRATNDIPTLVRVCRGMDSDLHRCRSPVLAKFREDMQPVYRAARALEPSWNSDEAQAATTAKANDYDNDLMHDEESRQSGVDIDFDPDTHVTTVTANAYFPGLSRDVANAIIAKADPPQWADTVRDFFKLSSPGLWNPKTAEFAEKNPSGTRRVGSYQLKERVEWNFAPELIGGIINILNIDDLHDMQNGEEYLSGPSSAESSDKLISAVESKLPTLTQHLQATNQDGRPRTQATTFRHYEYSLVRCVQSKFLASWERGGLDIDEGFYKAAWVPRPAHESGTLVIQARKAVHYSDRANVIPGLASVLNVMAPATISLLMRQLSYRGIRDGLSANKAAQVARHQS